MSDDKYPAAGPVLGPLLELIDLLEESSTWSATCECGWRSQDWDNEADATAEAWAHQPCYGPHNGWCECGWAGPKRIDPNEAQADWEQHRATHTPD